MPYAKCTIQHWASVTTTNTECTLDELLNLLSETKQAVARQKLHRVYRVRQLTNTAFIPRVRNQPVLILKRAVIS
jgi:hypothetical protein